MRRQRAPFAVRLLVWLVLAAIGWLTIIGLAWLVLVGFSWAIENTWPALVLSAMLWAIYVFLLRRDRR